MTESPLEECRKCKDFAMGEQIEMDMEEILNDGKEKA